MKGGTPYLYMIKRTYDENVLGDMKSAFNYRDAFRNAEFELSDSD